MQQNNYKPASVVRDDGDLEQATILIVGEAPGEQEMKVGIPFVGDSGRVLNSWLYEAGLKRNQCYVTNVLDRIPAPTNTNLANAIESGYVTRPDIENGYIRLHRTIAAMPNLRVIVPVGNYASYGLCGKGRVFWDGGTRDNKRPGINSIRGSLYHYTVPGTGKKISCIPTTHPSYVLRQSEWNKRCIYDWCRIADVHDNGAPEMPHRNFITKPSLAQIRDWFATVRPSQDALAIDIECWGGKLEMIGFAKSKSDAICIPTVPAYWHGYAALNEAWELMRPILQNPKIDKIFQNGLFDCWWISKYSKVEGYHWDTMGMHHAFEPLDRHSLEFMASIYCRYYEYWKDESKSAAEIIRYRDSVGLDGLYVYNCLDCVYTYELFEVFYDILEEKRLLPFYFKHYADMHKPLLNMSRTGALVDVAEMQYLRNYNIEQAREYRDIASRAAGKPLFTFDTTKCEVEMLNLYQNRVIENKGPFDYAEVANTLRNKGFPQKTIDAKWEKINDLIISDTRLREVLFTEWNAPRGKKTEKTFKDKLDDVSLRELYNKVKDRKRGLSQKQEILEVIDATQQCRRYRKLASFVDPHRVSSDSRIHSEYRYVTRSGRLSSKANPEGTGANLQNYDRTLNRIFKARPGRYIVRVDLSQAEGRVVKALTGSPTMIAMARMLPSEFDEHVVNAAAIFSAIEGREIDPGEIDYDRRQIGKRVVHAANYDMTKNRLVEVLLKEGYVVTPYEAGKMIGAYKERNPYLPIYHKKVRHEILQNEYLYTSWGRGVSFEWVRKDDHLFKFGYSYTPQSEIGDLTNQYGLVHIDNFISANKMDTELIMQVHDEIMLDAPRDEVYTVVESLGNSLSQPRRYGQCFGLDVELSIPCEVAIGSTRQTSHSWKYIPTQQELDDAMDEISSQQLIGAA